MSIWKFSNPNKFMTLSEKTLPIISVLTILTLATGLYWGFFLTPEDYQQGNSVKIIFLHVPSDLIAINT